MLDSGMVFTGGKDIVEKFFGMFWTAFPDFAPAPQLILVNGRNVAAVMMATGTNTGSFMGMPPTGKKIGLQGLFVVEFDEQGKIKSEIHGANPATILGQLGVAKMPTRPVMEKGWPEVQTVIFSDSKTENDNLALVVKGDELFSTKKIDELMVLFADDGVFSDSAMPADVTGKAAIAAVTKEYLGGFPDLAYTSKARWAAGDYVVEAIEWSGTNTGDFPSMKLKATGKPVKMTDYNLFKIKDGKVSNMWVFHNGMAMAIQLGLVPPPPAPPPAGAAPAAPPPATK
jgi:predicted ester cyclase